MYCKSNDRFKLITKKPPKNTWKTINEVNWFQSHEKKNHIIVTSQQQNIKHPDTYK